MREREGEEKRVGEIGREAVEIGERREDGRRGREENLKRRGEKEGGNDTEEKVESGKKSEETRKGGKEGE